MRQVWLDIFIGLTVVMWGASAVVVILTWRLHTPVPANACLITAATLSVITVLLAVATDNQRVSAANDRMVIEQVDMGLAAILAEAQKMHAKTCADLRRLENDLSVVAEYVPAAMADSRWRGYSDAVEDTTVGGGNVVQLPGPRRAGQPTSGHNGYGG